VRLNGLGVWAVCGGLYSAIWVPQAGAQTTNTAKPGDQLAPIQELYLPFLKEYGLVPIPLPQGQQVGDVFDGDGWRLLATADDCFPNLTVRSAPTELPSISGHGSKAIAAELGLTIVGSDLQLGEDRSYELSFSDAVAKSVSLVQLREKLRSGIPECDSVRPFLEVVNTGQEAPAPKGSPTDPPQVISTIIEARRVVRVSVRDTAQAQAEASIFSSWLKRIGLGSSAEVKVAVKDNGEAAVEIVGTDRVPVAFRPAYVAHDTGRDVITYRVTGFDPNRPDDREKLQDLVFGALRHNTP
jgi:hypothetical protein